MYFIDDILKEVFEVRQIIHAWLLQLLKERTSHAKIIWVLVVSDGFIASGLCKVFENNVLTY